MTVTAERDLATPPVAGTEPTDGSRTVRRGHSIGWSAAVLVTVLVVTAVFSWLSLVAYQHTERALLRLRAEDAASVVQQSTTSIQTELQSGADVAAASGGNAARFDTLMGQYVGARRPFTAASLWKLTATGAVVLASTGNDADLASHPARAAAFVRAHAEPTVLGVSPLIHASDGLRIGFAVGAPPPATDLVAYAEVKLPGNRRIPLSASSPFSDLHYSIYLGRTQDPAQLVLTDQPHLPVQGRAGVATVPFGSSSVTVVVTARAPLTGALLHDLWWIVALVGTALAALAAAGTDRTVQRRLHAEALAVALDDAANQNRELYRQQRSIAHTLQHALLPERLPQVPGLQADASYVAGVTGTEIGGDWYDLVALDGDQAMLVMGDVSGRGLRAAAVMASLRFAARAYAVQGDAPERVLTRLSRLLDLESEGHFATVLCAQVDVAGHRVSVASAGHPPPLLIGSGRADFVPVVAGLPIGVGPVDHYEVATTTVPPGATLLAFTDGVVERRGELLDVGLDRLRTAALDASAGGGIGDLVRAVVAAASLSDATDDAALLGVRWLT